MFETLFTQPLYNGFIKLIDIMPGGDVGLAIIVLTLIIRIIFYPAFASQIRTSIAMQAVQGELEEIKQKYKNDRDKQNKQVLELFKKNKINPFAAILSLIIQIPIFIALYFTFIHTTLPEIDVSLLYSFVEVPTLINIQFLGVLNLALSQNIFLVLIVAGLQYLVMRLSFGRSNASMPKNIPPERAIVQKMQQNMMLYMLPAVIGVVAYTTPSAVGLYFAAGSVISLGQEWLIRKEFAKKQVI